MVRVRGYGGRRDDVPGVGCNSQAEAVLRHPWGNSISLPVSGLDVLRLRQALALRRFFQQNHREFDIVEVSNWPGTAAWLPSGVRYVVRLSSPSREGYPASIQLRLNNALERRTCARAAFLFANSGAMYERAKHYYGCESKPHAVVPYGLPDIIPQAAPAQSGLRVLYIGRAEFRKGTDTLLKALDTVLPSCPDFQFRLIGA